MFNSESPTPFTTRLVWTLEQGLGSEWTPEVKVAWSATYALLADAMRAAAGELVSRLLIPPKRSRLVFAGHWRP
jgi:hypothetical protein